MLLTTAAAGEAVQVKSARQLRDDGDGERQAGGDQARRLVAEGRTDRRAGAGFHDQRAGDPIPHVRFAARRVHACIDACTCR